MNKIIVKKIPESPGVYIFKNKDNKPIYVGKALNLKKRVSSYFNPTSSSSSKHSAKTITLVKNICEIDFIITENEEEALIKENELIKKFQPKYNILLRDDKSFPYIKITLFEKFPQIYFTRELKQDGSLYFGPYPHVSDAKKIIEYIMGKYCLRQCKKKFDKQYEKACLNFEINKCKAPCIGNVSEAEYGKLINKACDFLKGRQKEILKQLVLKMQKFSDNLEFEKAGEIRDMIKGAKSVQRISLLKKEKEYDIILLDIKEKLGLKNLPKRIECYDISNISGKAAVGSKVSFLEGKPDKGEYRRYKIKTITGANDTAMMREVILRRFIGNTDIYPDLVLLDGGKPQLNIVIHALKDLEYNFDIISIAKKQELIYKYGRKEPVILPKYSEELSLIRRIRDEAHRFAITYHRKLREKNFMVSKKKI